MKVGFVEAFTGHYRSSRMIARFLELMGVEVVRSGITTPAILEAGTTLASADFCVPLRVYVGHVHRLLADHPDLDFLLAPNVLSEDGKSSTCAKDPRYRRRGDAIPVAGYRLLCSEGRLSGRLSDRLPCK